MPSVTKQTRSGRAVWQQLVADGVIRELDCAIKNGEFGEERYQAEGPNKHQQEDDGLHTARMFANWAGDFMGEKWPQAPRPDQQSTRCVAEYLYNKLGYGIFENKKSDWDSEFPGTDPLAKCMRI